MGHGRHIAGRNQPDHHQYTPDAAPAMGDDTHQNEQIVDPADAEAAATMDVES